MINVQSLLTPMRAALDAENSERYTFNNDFRPAINFSIDWMVAVFNAAFAQKKLSEENLRDLLKVKIFQANNFSRVLFDPAQVGHGLWSLIAVYPDPVVYPSVGAQSLSPAEKSVYVPDCSFVSVKPGKVGAKRLTFEQWNETVQNVFVPGNTILKGGLIEYAYLNFADYSSTNYQDGNNQEIEIRPSVAKQLVALAYLKVPTKVVTENDNIEFPESLTDLIFQKALNFIAYKQGDGTSLYNVSEKDISRLISLMI